MKKRKSRIVEIIFTFILVLYTKEMAIGPRGLEKAYQEKNGFFSIVNQKRSLEVDV